MNTNSILAVKALIKGVSCTTVNE